MHGIGEKQKKSLTWLSKLVKSRSESCELHFCRTFHQFGIIIHEYLIN